MRDDLLHYYERELGFLRQMGAEFAAKYPKIASRLLLEPGKCEDPHVERLLEGFSFLAARIHLKIDDEFPEIVESLLQIVYPNYLRPIPSMSVVQFHLDPEQGKLASGLRIEKGTMLYTQPVGGAPCKFRTCYETVLWPLAVRAAEWRAPDRLNPPVRGADAAAALRVELHCLPDVTAEKLEMATLRFFLSGEGGLTHSLAELLCNNCYEVLARDLSAPARKTVRLPGRLIRHVGFQEEEGMIPFPRRSFLGYRLLHEYFAFPEKFCFIDVGGLHELAAGGFGDKFELIFLISPFERTDRRQMLEMGVTPRTFRLGCSPVINLFEQTSEPVLLDHKKFEYRIVPDARREATMDIFSVDSVTGVSQRSSEPVRYEPFFSYLHASRDARKEAFWHINRKRSGWRSDKGTDVYISLVDLSGRPIVPEEETITVRLTCSNRDLPSRLPFGGEDGDFQMEGGGPIARIVALVKPTDSIEPPGDKSLLWRLVSQLSLNYLSLVEEGREALQEILRLHNFPDSLHTRKQIEGIVNLRSEPRFTRIISESGISFVRGTTVEIEFDEEQFVGSGVYTFASVLEQFLAMYVSMNSFSQLAVRTRQRKRILKEWAPRSGRRILL